MRPIDADALLEEAGELLLVCEKTRTFSAIPFVMSFINSVNNAPTLEIGGEEEQPSQSEASDPDQMTFDDLQEDIND